MNEIINLLTCSKKNGFYRNPEFCELFILTTLDCIQLFGVRKILIQFKNLDPLGTSAQLIDKEEKEA